MKKIMKLMVICVCIVWTQLKLFAFSAKCCVLYVLDVCVCVCMRVCVHACGGVCVCV